MVTLKWAGNNLSQTAGWAQVGAELRTPCNVMELMVRFKNRGKGNDVEKSTFAVMNGSRVGVLENCWYHEFSPDIEEMSA